MIRSLGFGESQVFHFLLGVLVSLFLCVLGMRNNDGPKPHSGRTNGFIPTSFRAISGYLRIVSSGASTVASTVRSAASSIVDRDDDASHDQLVILLWPYYWEEHNPLHVPYQQYGGVVKDLLY